MSLKNLFIYRKDYELFTIHVNNIGHIREYSEENLKKVNIILT